MKKLYVISCLLCYISILYQCTKRPDVVNPQPLSETQVKLRWVKNYADEDPEKVRTGLMWAMTFAGAMLPKDKINDGLKTTNDNSWIIDFTKLGFNDNALQEWKKIIALTKETEEYKHFGSVDLSRFLVFSIYTPLNYYKITGIPDSLTSLIQKPIDDTIWKNFPVINSSVANGQRILKYQTGGNILNRKYLAIEGEGRIQDNNFKDEVYEIIDVMKNGQLRYSIYDVLGKLQQFSPTKFGRAGKPTKCMWCHEGHLLPLFSMNPDIPGFQTASQFILNIQEANQLLKAYRESLNTALNYAKYNEHELSELLYISFMEPSAERLAIEWRTNVATVKEKLKDVPTHTNPEYTFLGDLYHRADADKLLNYKTLPVPLSIREP